MDPSIVQARERVLGAETAEREADRALEVARHEVREAREHVKRLELEAKEEARRARIKQFHAKEVSKRGKALGREFPPSPALAMTVLVVLVLTCAQQATISRRPPPQSTSPDRTNLLLNRRGRETNLHTLTHTHTRDTTPHTYTYTSGFIQNKTCGKGVRAARQRASDVAHTQICIIMYCYYDAPYLRIETFPLETLSPSY